MKDRPAGTRVWTAEQRQRIEADHTFQRAVELELEPVHGVFDAAHLKEVNRRLFQDLPGAGFEDVTPGQFRKPVPDGLDWMKQRGLSTIEGAFYVAYSRMDGAARARLDNALEKASPEALRGLKTPEFSARFAAIYTELDYVHPFSDGNSRTLRSFTRQLARQAGYSVDWERFSRSDVGRDLLYIARDLSVNALAKHHVQHENTLRKILYTQDRLDGNRALPDLLRDAIRPSRALAFEQLDEAQALQEYPELKEAYQIMHRAVAHFASTMQDQPQAQQACIQYVRNHVQDCLNAGETADFSGDQEQEKRQPPPQGTGSGPLTR